MKIKLSLLTILSIALTGGLETWADSSNSSPSPPATATATAFLNHLEKTEISKALTLWDSKTVNDKLRGRLEKMSAKIKAFGGIKKVDVGTCENRRIEAFEKQTGERIDVIPVEIISGNENLFLAVFSVRKINGEHKIFLLESLKEWGGTASLDDELSYRH